jgi:hypothetical protein
MARPKIVAFVIAIAITSACELAHAQSQHVLDVDSDAPEIISREAISARVAAELAGSSAPVTITIRYRDADRSLVVRATREDGRSVERAVKAEGDASAVQREAVLLAGNVARDEARELLDALAARPPKPAPAPEPPAIEPAPAPPPKETPAPRREEVRIANVGLAYPLSTNFGRPWVTTYFDFSFVFGLVGKVKGMQLGTGGVMAPELRGLQLAPVTIAEDVEGVQLGVVNIARRVKGAQVGVINIAEEVDGGTLGMISIHRDAFHPVAWGGNLGYLNLGIALESRWLYTIVAAQYGTLETGLEPRVGTVGVAGVRVPIVSRLEGGLETSFSSIDPASTKAKAVNVWFHQRAVVGWRFAKRFRVFAAGGFRAPVAIDEGSHAFRPDFTGGLEL